MTIPAATYGFSNFNTALGASQYKAQLDANSSAAARLSDTFAPHAGTTPSLNVYLDPGFVLNGTSLTEVGVYTTATFTSGSTSATVANPLGVSGTMWIADNIGNTYIAPGTTCTISGSTLTLNNATLQSGTNIQVVIGQISAAIVAPVSHPRIDRIVVSSSTGAVSIITGTPGSNPAIPALTAGVLPIAQVLVQTTSTSITNSMITDERAIGSGGGVNDTEATVASATTTDLGATNVNAILISGTTTITGFGSNGNTTNPYYDVRFSGALILTYNGTSLVLPGKVNITTIAGDRARFQYMGSGNWQCVYYSRASGAPVIEGPSSTIASASTTDIGSTGVTTVTISGTTTITGLGSTATTDNPIYFLTFSGALTLTYNATSLILPGKQTITTAANDTCVAQYLGSGNWQVLIYSLASGKSIIGAGVVTVKRQAFAASGTYTPSAGMLYCDVEGVGGGGGGGGTNGSVAVGGGGGAGSYSKILLTAANIGASKAVAIGAAGSAGANTGGTGGTGGNTTLGSTLMVANGGVGGVGSTNTSGAQSNSGGAGGAAGTGDVADVGQSGFPSIYIAGSSPMVYPGIGGSSIWGGGGQGVIQLSSSPTATIGVNATGYGSGGSGSIGSSKAGGAGTIGYMIITEYCSQ